MNDAEKLQWLFDVENIKQLKHRYCAYCDEGYDPDGICSLFIEDGVWDGGLFGRHAGHAEIHAFFSGASKLISFANHYVSNPIIEVDGDAATGRWDLWQPMVSEPETTACWLMAKYKEQYVKIDDRWLFKNLEVHALALSPYDQGFAKQRFMETS
jgi:hypothetical protein